MNSRQRRRRRRALERTHRDFEMLLGKIRPLFAAQIANMLEPSALERLLGDGPVEYYVPAGGPDGGA